MVLSFTPLGGDPRAIRLVEVHGFDKYGYIKCSIRNKVLGQDSFLALSHVWGSENPTYKITVNGNSCWVRPNLWYFLTYATEKFCGIDLWIDALCIDQNNIAEKNRQIPLMRHVFSQATNVISWLHGLCGTYNFRNSSIVDPNAVGPQLLSQTVMGQYNNDFTYTKVETVVAALVRLLGHEYWSRLWIIQELHFARQVELHWACQRIDWRRLKSFITSLMQKSRLINDSMRLMAELLMTGPWQISGLPFFNLLDDEPGFHTLYTPVPHLVSKNGPTVLQMVLRFQRHSCSILHDRVYALLSLATNGHNFAANYSESRVSLLARVLTGEVHQPELELTESVGKMLNIDLQEWIRFQAIAVRNAGHGRFLPLYSSGAKLFDHEHTEFQFNLAPWLDDTQNYIIACFGATKYCCLLTYDQSFAADFVCTVRFRAAENGSDQVEIGFEPMLRHMIPDDIVYWPSDGEVAFRCMDWSELHRLFVMVMGNARLTQHSGMLLEGVPI